MPQGCGTWPAVWEADDQVGSSAGEVDILEGVNDVAPNSVTLHTNGTCTMPDNNKSQLGYVPHAAPRRPADRAPAQEAALDGLQLAEHARRREQRVLRRRAVHGVVREGLQHVRRRVLRARAHRVRHPRLVLGAQRHQHPVRYHLRRVGDQHEQVGAWSGCLIDDILRAERVRSRERRSRISRARTATFRLCFSGTTSLLT